MLESWGKTKSETMKHVACVRMQKHAQTNLSLLLRIAIESCLVVEVQDTKSKLIETTIANTQITIVLQDNH